MKRNVRKTGPTPEPEGRRLPLREEERERARKILAAVEADAASLEWMSHEAVAATLPFETGHGANAPGVADRPGSR